MLINKEELLKALQDDNGLQYPRWWYLEKVREMPEVQPEDEDCDTCKHGDFGGRQCDNCRVGYPSHYERKDDGRPD